MMRRAKTSPSVTSRLLSPHRPAPPPTLDALAAVDLAGARGKLIDVVLPSLSASTPFAGTSAARARMSNVKRELE